MMDTIVAAIKKQRLVWSCALLVALFLLHVLVGCALASLTLLCAPHKAANPS